MVSNLLTSCDCLVRERSGRQELALDEKQKILKYESRNAKDEFTVVLFAFRV